MEILCSVDGESLSRFVDAELSPSARLEVEAHVSTCLSCKRRLDQFRLADSLLARVRVARPQPGRMVASVSVAAALLTSLAANAFLVPPRKALAPSPPLQMSAAPSETLTSFYEKVAPPRARP